MLMRSILCALLAISIPTQASAESWLCIADMAAGMKFDKANGKYENTTFSVASSRFIIRPTDDPMWKYEVNQFGSESPYSEAKCAAELNENGYLLCKSLSGDFRFNSKSLRYIRTSLMGYVEVIPEQAIFKDGLGDPLIEIGRCSKI